MQMQVSFAGRRFDNGQDVPAVRQSSCLCSGRWNRHGPHHAVSPLIPSKRFHEGPNRSRCRRGVRLEAISASGHGKGHHIRSGSSGNFSTGEGASNYLSSEAVEGAFAWCARTSINGKRRQCAGRSWENWTLGLDPKELERYLKLKQLILENDYDAAHDRERFRGNESEKRKAYDFYHVALASLGK